VGVPFLIALVVGAMALSHIVPGAFLLEAFNPDRSIWRVRQVAGEPPAVFLTFDDGPNERWTPPLLDALRETGARATFFLIDEHMTGATAPIVARIAREGHAIGLHSGSRRQMFMPPAQLAAELAAAAARIEAMAGRAPCRLFRPHGGWRSGTLYEGLDLAGYQLAGWTWGMWDFDWGRTREASRLAPRLIKKASAGDVIVIHDGHHKDPTKDRAHAAETVRVLVPALRARGVSFRPLCP
jgi:peptidoglycan/xylan/chitin deacetylase (PgdA/CDA1 family)